MRKSFRQGKRKIVFTGAEVKAVALSPWQAQVRFHQVDSISAVDSQIINSQANC